MALGMAALKKIAPKAQATTKKGETPIIEFENTPENHRALATWLEGKKSEQQGETLRKQQEEILRPQAADGRVKVCNEDHEFYGSIKLKIAAVVIGEGEGQMSKADADKHKASLGEAAYNRLKLNLPTEAASKYKADLGEAEFARIFGELGPVTFVTQEKYSEIATEHEEAIRAMFKIAEPRLDDPKLPKADREKLEAEKAEKEDALFHKYFTEDAKIEVSDEGKKKLETLLPALMEACGGEEKFISYFKIKTFLTPTEKFHRERVTDPDIIQKADDLIDAGIVKPTNPSFRI